MYNVSHVVIPYQRTSAVCWAVGDERQINNFFSTHPDLLFLGFVRTEPEASILSSFDLHSLAKYASRNPAFISLLQSPQEKTYRTFSLTTQGIQKLSACMKTGLHQHPPYVNSWYIESPNILRDERQEIKLIDYRLAE